MPLCAVRGGLTLSCMYASRNPERCVPFPLEVQQLNICPGQRVRSPACSTYIGAARVGGVSAGAPALPPRNLDLPEVTGPSKLRLSASYRRHAWAFKPSSTSQPPRKGQRGLEGEAKLRAWEGAWPWDRVQSPRWRASRCPTPQPGHLLLPGEDHGASRQLLQSRWLQEPTGWT